jgi:transcription initiation factor TFIIH subunit 2
VLIIYGALLSSDPGDIHQTITALVADKIRVNIVGLAAQVAICHELVVKTNSGDDSGYGVALNEQHFRDLFLSTTTPPVTKATTSSASSLLMMGFPSRIVEDKPSLCACHSNLTRGGYLCSRCKCKVCSLPAECPACGLTLILSTHLARSYHHLFPLRNWKEVPWREARSTACFSCLSPFPPVPSEFRVSLKKAGKQRERPQDSSVKKSKATGTSQSSRYRCEVCNNHFCIDCDVFAHEVVHNCPGCQSVAPPIEDEQMLGTGEDGATTNGQNGHVDDGMDTS